MNTSTKNAILAASLTALLAPGVSAQLFGQEPGYDALEGPGGSAINQAQEAERRALAEAQRQARQAREAQFAALEAEVERLDDVADDAGHRARRFVRFAENQVREAERTGRAHRFENDDMDRAREYIGAGRYVGLQLAIDNYGGHADGARTELAQLKEVSVRLATLEQGLQEFVVTCQAELRGEMKLDYNEDTRFTDVTTWGDGVGVAFNQATSWRFKTRREMSWARGRLAKIRSVRGDIEDANKSLVEIETMLQGQPG